MAGGYLKWQAKIYFTHINPNKFFFSLEAFFKGDRFFITEDGRYGWIAKGVPIPDSWGKAKEMTKADFYFSYRQKCEETNRPLKLREAQQKWYFSNTNVENLSNIVPLPNFN